MTDSSMLKYQYSTMLDQLILLQLHAEDPNCPCSLRGAGGQGEWCEPKHTRAIVALARETISMESDEARVDYLEGLVLEGTELLGKMEKKLCGEEIDFGDLVIWARDKRKPLEAMVYEGFCDLAPVDDALVKEVARMFSEEGEMVILQEPIAVLAEAYVLFKRYHPRTGITEMIVTFAFPKGIGTLPFIEDISKEEQKGVLATIASLAKEIGYEMRPETDRTGQFRVRRELNTIAFNLADWIGLTAKGEPFLMPDSVLKQALKESFTFGFDYKGKAESMPAGGMIEKPKIVGELPKVKYIIKQTCTGTPPICTFEIVRKAETTEIDIAKDEPELLAKLPSIIRPDTVAKVREDVARMFEKTGCPCRIGIEPEMMSVQEIQDELNALLFDEETQKACNAEDRELLTIVIAQPKAHHFDFLTGKTEWRVRGKWRRPNEGFDIEANVQLDVEFKDAADECVGKRVIELLKAYNTKVVGETILYARIIPIEEGTLEEAAKMAGKTGDKVSLIKSILDYEIYLGKLEYGVASTLSRAKELAKLGMKELELLWRELLAKSYERGKIIEQSVYIGLGRKVPAYLQESTLSSIGSAAVTGVGIGAGFKFIDWLAKKFSEKGAGLGAPKKLVPTISVVTYIYRGFEIVLNKKDGLYHTQYGVFNTMAQAVGDIDSRFKYGKPKPLPPKFSDTPPDQAGMGLELPAYVDVFSTTIAKHYRPTEDFHDGSIRVLKPEKDILVYLGCLKSDDWDGERCSPNPTVLKTITPNSPKYREELDHLKLVHPETKINYRTKEIGVEPIVSEEDQEEVEAVGKALEHTEEVR